MLPTSSRGDRARGGAAARRSERGPRQRRDEVLFELQIHPGDIRKRVRHLFVTRRQAVFAGVAAALWIVLVAGGLAAAPPVVSTLLALDEVGDLQEERAALVETLDQRIVELEDLRGRTSALRGVIDQVFLLYGLPTDQVGGLGGVSGAPPLGPKVAGGSAAERLEYARRLWITLEQGQRVSDQLLTEIDEFEEARAHLVRITPSILPLAGEFVLSGPYGDRTHPFTGKPDLHVGIDLSAPEGTPVLAAGDGEVLFAGWYTQRQSIAWHRYGRLVMIGHGEDFVTLYAHCDELKVATGDRVKRGQEIATVGNTGWSTNNHLHYEVRRWIDGEKVPLDPRLYILDHWWSDRDEMLARSRRRPGPTQYQPLPPLVRP